VWKGDHQRVQRRPSSLEPLLECLECGEESAEGRGWKAFVDEELELLVYCAACAEREFGE
jgi:transcription elongation factor Elf1